MVSHGRTTTAIGEQAIMAGAVEPAGPHVDKGAADELVNGECHHLGPLLLPGAVLWGEGLSPTGLTMQINALRAPVREAPRRVPHFFPETASGRSPISPWNGCPSSDARRYRPNQNMGGGGSNGQTAVDRRHRGTLVPGATTLGRPRQRELSGRKIKKILFKELLVASIPLQ